MHRNSSSFSTIWRLSCLILIASLLLASCTGGGTKKQEVTFMVFGDPAEAAAYEALVAAFEAEYPDIDILFSALPSQNDYNQRLAAGFSGGSPPDVMLLNYRRFALFAAQKALEPLDAYFERSTLLDPGAFYPQPLSAFKFQQQQWCIPQNVSSLVVYYNLDLFDAAGLSYPSQDWSQEDFMAAARALTRDVDGDGKIDQYGVGIEPSLMRLAPFVWQAGGDIVDNAQQPTRLSLDSPAALAAFQWFVDLQVKEGMTPDMAAETAEASENRFLNGRLGMYFNSRRGTPTYRTISDFAWDVAPLPKGQQAASILHSDGYCMAAAAKNKEAAWKFIEYANSSAGQTLIAKSGRTVPSLSAVAESPDFLDPKLAPPSSRVFLDVIPSLRGLPLMSTWPAIEEIANREIERAFYGEISVSEAAAAAAAQTQTYFEQAFAKP